METHLRRAQAAEYVQSKYGFCTTETLAKLACVGGGPRFRKLGRYPVYTAEDLDAWIRSRLTPAVSNTSELSKKAG